MTNHIKTCEEILSDFDKQFPPFSGVGAPHPLFENHPNPNHIKQFIIQAVRTAVESCRPKKVKENVNWPDMIYNGDPKARAYNSALSDMDSLKSSFFGEKK